MNRQQLLSRLATQGHYIVYSTGQWSIWDRSKSAWKDAANVGRYKLEDGVWNVSSPKWLMRFPSLPIADKLSLFLWTQLIKIKFNISRSDKLILHIFHPEFFPYIKFFKKAKIVYHAYDLFEMAQNCSPEMEKQENSLVMQADLCIATSEAIAKRLEERTGREFRVLPNGADCAVFQNALEQKILPTDLEKIPHPRIGYVGRINKKIDLELISKLATNRPEWNFVLVGPVSSLDDVTEQAMVRCRQLANVFELGEKRHTQLPAYVAGLDVALMPYRTGVGFWTAAGYPLKLHEYLAADKPIVSSPLSSVLPFSEVVDLVETLEEWELAIDAALEHGGKGQGRRVAVARENDWSIRADILNSWLVEMFENDETL
jgi:glycosyltransferase involved in cell wall biosynthesis